MFVIVWITVANDLKLVKQHTIALWISVPGQEYPVMDFSQLRMSFAIQSALCAPRQPKRTCTCVPPSSQRHPPQPIPKCQVITNQKCWSVANNVWGGGDIMSVGEWQVMGLISQGGGRCQCRVTFDEGRCDTSRFSRVTIRSTLRLFQRPQVYRSNSSSIYRSI